MKIVLEAKNIYFTYPDGEKVLHGINFQAGKGEFIGLMGANGSGKTTLFQHFNGLLKPQTGEICLNGNSIGQKSVEDVFRTVGLVFQDPNDQLFALNVAEDISYGPKNAGLPPELIKQNVQKVMEMMGIQELAHRTIHSLSYGQKKKVAIAGILVLEPEVIILDEPTSGLDPVAASKLMHLLKTVQRKTDMTIIISTHEVDLVPIYCDRVYIMNKGQISLSGTAEEVFTQTKKLRDLNLRLPRVAHLVEVLNSKDGWNLHKPGLTISQARKALKNYLQCKI